MQMYSFMYVIHKYIFLIAFFVVENLNYSYL